MDNTNTMGENEGNNERRTNRTAPGDHKEYSELNICTYNIVAGGNHRIEQVMRCMELMNIDLGIITETKLQGKKAFRFKGKTKGHKGYTVVPTEAKSKYQGGVALFYTESPYFTIEGTKTFGPNVIRAIVKSGEKQWRIIGAYIPPSEEDGSTLNFIEAAAAESMEIPLILLGDLNVDLKKMRETGGTSVNERHEETVALVASLGVDDMNQHFRQEKKYGDWTWSNRRRGEKRVISRCDYILATNKTDFRTLRIRDPRGFDTDHRMVIGVIRTGSRHEHKRYIKGRSKFEWKNHTGNGTGTEEVARIDALFDELVDLIKKPTIVDGRDSSWISEKTWKFIDAKAEARKRGDRKAIAEARKNMAKSLKADKLADIEGKRSEIEEALKNNDTRTAYGKVRKWCKEKPAHVPKPTLQDEEKTRSDFEKLYTVEESPGEPIPVREVPFEISDVQPTEEEICRALRRMKTGKAPGASGMKVEHLKLWMENAKASAKGEQCNPAMVAAWKKVQEIIEIVFQGKEPPKVFAFGILTLIPKADPTQMRGIALLEVIYKLIAAIINNRMVDAISFHKAIHGFRVGRSTMTATMILKLIMQYARRTTNPTYYVFLDLKKAYDTMDRKRTLEIIKAYGAGPIILGIIEKTWENDTVVPKQDKYYAEPFSASRGVRQGDILSPMIFNIVVDAVIRESEFQFCEGDASRLESVEELFYADDGALAGENPLEIQRLLDIYTTNFARMGLKMNAEKTEAIIMKGGDLKLKESKEAYDLKFFGIGKTTKEKMKEKVKCEHCGKELSRKYLAEHQRKPICESKRKVREVYCSINQNPTRRSIGRPTRRSTERPTGRPTGRPNP